MRYIASIVVGAIGIGFALLNCIAVMRTIAEGITVAQQVMAPRNSNVSLLAAVIGETLVAVSSRGVFAILPALLILIALIPLRLRERWFYRCAFASSIYFVLVPPFATIYGIVLLIALKRRRSDFRRVSVPTLEEADTHPQPSELSFPPRSET